MDSGHDLLTTCGNPANIYATYVVGIGGICSHYNDWTEYSLFASADLALIADNCSAAAIGPLPCKCYNIGSIGCSVIFWKTFLILIFPLYIYMCM